jgi:hypothetical protein
VPRAGAPHPTYTAKFFVLKSANGRSVIYNSSLCIYFLAEHLFLLINLFNLLIYLLFGSFGVTSLAQTQSPPSGRKVRRGKFLCRESRVARFFVVQYTKIYQKYIPKKPK